MKNKICILVLLVFLTGCTATYNLEINDGKFKEQIEGSFNYDELDEGQKATLPLPDNFKQGAFYNNNDEYFMNINFDESDTKNNIKIDYEYTEKNFDNAYLINACFDSHLFVNSDDYYYIKLMGDFKCEYASSTDIIINTDYRVLDTNAKRNNGKYVWKLDDSDNKNLNLYIQISKTEKKGEVSFKFEVSTFKWISLVILIVLSGVTFFLYKKKNSGKM